MGDHVLALHRVDDGATARLYDVSGLRTASIRDQMVRAHLLVLRLFANRMFENGERLLVIGGGAGGVSAAMTAAALGVGVQLCEARGHLFSMQLWTDRFIDPAEYDWPHAHWDSGVFPSQAPPMPLPFPAAKANRLAMHWQLFFRRWLKTAEGRLVELRPRTSVLPRDIVAHVTHLETRGPRFPTPGRFAAALSFAGMKREKCAIPEKGPLQFQGFRYWGFDPYGQEDLGLPNRSIRVLVSGGGDGAMQDFIRILTGLSAKECLQVLLPDPVMPPDVVALAREDEVGKRSHAWRAGRGKVHRSMQRWHDAYESAVERLWGSWDKARRDALAERLLRKNILAHHAIACSHFDFSFGLNRFVHALVVRLHAHARPAAELSEVLLTHLKLVEIEALDGHVCGNPGFCHGLPHRAMAVSAECVTVGTDPTDIGTFDVIVVRHGMIPNRVLGTPAIDEHWVPFHVPG